MKSDTKVTQQELPEVTIEVKPKSLSEKLFAIRHLSNLRIAALGDSAVFGVGDTSTDGKPDGPGWVGRLAHDLAASQ